MAELNIQLEVQRSRQAELLETIAEGYDEQAMRELNILNNNTQVTESRIKKTFKNNKITEPYKLITKTSSIQ